LKDGDALEKDTGVLTFENEVLLLKFLGSSDSIRVADTAQLSDHQSPDVKALLDQPVTILWTKVGEIDGTPRMMAHKVVPHEAIRQRAFEISRSDESDTAVENWLRAEVELLGPQSN
jgi:hypothetical protein